MTRLRSLVASVRAALVVAVRPLAVRAAPALAVFSLACGISPDDPLPETGKPCSVDEAQCGLEHVCRPAEAGATDGVCMPVLTFGACDDVDGPPRHAPGRLGDESPSSEIEIAAVEDYQQLEDVRSVVGQVRVFNSGPGSAEVGTTCPLRALQRVGNGFAVGDSDVTSLDGLQSLTSIDGGLAIFSNRELLSLAGLANVVAVGERAVGDFASFHVIIAGNTELPQSEVAAFTTRLQDQNNGALRIVACDNANDSPDCDDAERDLLAFIVQNGLR